LLSTFYKEGTIIIYLWERVLAIVLVVQKWRLYSLT
jgi:hypothetical protein